MNSDIDLQLAIDPHFEQSAFLQQILTDAEKEKIFIHVDNNLNNWTKEFHGLNAPHSYRGIFTVLLTQNYLQKKLQPSDASITTIANLFSKPIQQLKEACVKNELDLVKMLEAMRLYSACVYCEIAERKFHFTFPVSEEPARMTGQWEKMIKVIAAVQQENEETIEWIDSLPRQKNNLSFLLYDESIEKWNLIDRLRDSSLQLSQRYRNDINDPRIRKPYVVFNEDNYNQYTYFDNQWSLEMEATEIILPQPNDVAIYVSITDKNLEKAEKFLNEEYGKRVGKLHLPLLRTEEYLNYYDYFESIIAAVIFSYTSIEALANICIPNDYKYTEIKKEGVETVYDKRGIERWIDLRKKFKVILTDILKTPNPAEQSWWSRFLELESLRNEIIHTKQRKSEERYSALLNRKVVSYIKVHKEMIQFYAHYINLNYRSLLFDIPYDFGADEVTPSFMSDADFQDYDIHRHNLWRPEKKDNETQENK